MPISQFHDHLLRRTIRRRLLVRDAVTKRANAPPSPFPSRPIHPSPRAADPTPVDAREPPRASSPPLARTRRTPAPDSSRARALNPSPPRARIHPTSFSRSNTLDVDTTDDDDDERASFLSPLIPVPARARATRRHARESPAAGAVGRSPGRSVAGTPACTTKRGDYSSLCFMYGLTVYTHEKPKRFPSRDVFLRATFRTRSTDRSTMDALNHRVPFLLEGLDMYIHTGMGAHRGPTASCRHATTRCRRRRRERRRGRGRRRDASENARARRARVFFFFVFVVVVVERASIRDATRANAPR